MPGRILPVNVSRRTPLGKVFPLSVSRRSTSDRPGKAKSFLPSVSRRRLFDSVSRRTSEGASFRLPNVRRASEDGSLRPVNVSRRKLVEVGKYLLVRDARKS
uniref:Uncharacterized protein n=1 Tax=Cacopsylla melanoneura TaxID=428564 RepID=A0A8D9ATE4_9HEMI